MKLIINSLLVLLAFTGELASSGIVSERSGISCVVERENELAALPEAKPKLQAILSYLSSEDILATSQKSPSLEILRKRLLTSLFHLNFAPEFLNKNIPHYNYIKSQYPYDPVYETPIPKRPSLEVIHEFIQFATLVKNHSEFLFEKDHDEKRNMAEKIIFELSSFAPYREFNEWLNTFELVDVPTTNEISKDHLINHPTDSYFIMRQRLKDHGEVAAFPEFADSVDVVLQELYSDEIQKLAKKDPIFIALVDTAVSELQTVKQQKAASAHLQAAFNEPYPYRRTINAIELAVGVFDLKERLKYPESKDWYEVEESWYLKNGIQRLLPLYHFNRYKYQQFGLLSNNDVVLIPWVQDASIEDLIRLRSVPIGIVGVTFQTLRVDRHHNSPLDFWYHDINHIRRMMGYDKLTAQSKHLKTLEELRDDMNARQEFIEDLLAKTDPNQPGLSQEEKQIRVLERFILFETFHETALSATRESLLNDLTRRPATPQPFEVQIQGDEYFKELNRQFDGNLKSGADLLEVVFSEPTRIQYFFDRAPGFLSNVYNKLAFGFHGSVFEERSDADNLKYRKPEYLAQATLNVFKILGLSENEIPPLDDLIKDITDRSGQPELYNYFALRQEEDQSSVIRTQMGELGKTNLIREEIQTARKLKNDHSEMTSSEVAKKVLIPDEYKNILKFMLLDLENYDVHFNEFFDAKLSRGDARSFADSADYIRQFVGTEKGKLLATYPSEEEMKILDKGGMLYVDTWAVPFFNTATQNKEEAHRGIKNTLKVFRALNFDDDISIYQFAELVSLYARPEFDDVRRYKLQLFPTEIAVQRFGKERNDSKVIGDHFPTDAFIVTTRKLSLDELSYTFGCRLHFMGLIPHSDTIRADHRLFVGTADFFEHDSAHGYFSLELPVPGEPEEWIKVHEEYRLLQANIADPKIRLMNSLVYFHFTHESAYKSMIPDVKGNLPDSNAYKKELEWIKQRIETKNDYDWIKNPENIGENYEELLNAAFERVTTFFKNHLKQIQDNHS